MKKLVTLLLTVVLMLGLTGCGELSATFAIVGEKSMVYTETDINEAMDVVLDCFRKEFDGCTLLELGYAGDDTRAEQKEWATQYDADECILLVCSFETDGTVGPLNPNSTYENYKWVLTRTGGGEWEIKTNGYA